MFLVNLLIFIFILLAVYLMLEILCHLGRVAHYNTLKYKLLVFKVQEFKKRQFEDHFAKLTGKYILCAPEMTKVPQNGRTAYKPHSSK